MNRRGFFGQLTCAVVAAVARPIVTPCETETKRFTHKEYGFDSRYGFYTQEQVDDGRVAIRFDRSVYDPITHLYRTTPLPWSTP